jgi:N-acetylmuramoyl-L-alanine amidase
VTGDQRDFLDAERQMGASWPQTPLTSQQALIATLYGECRNQPLEGQLAVAWVVRNRADRLHDRTRAVAKVCLARDQFSCWWGDSTNARATQAFAGDLLAGGTPAEAALARRLAWIADGVMRDCIEDPTGGATHYLTRDLYERNPPSWARRAPLVTIGDHVFLS